MSCEIRKRICTFKPFGRSIGFMALPMFEQLWSYIQTQNQYDEAFQKRMRQRTGFRLCFLSEEIHAERKFEDPCWTSS